MKALVIDVGGTHVKILATGERTHREFPSGPTLTASADEGHQRRGDAGARRANALKGGFRVWEDARRTRRTKGRRAKGARG